MDVLPSGTGISLGAAVPAWSNTIPLALPGTSAAALFNLYPTLGAQTISTTTNITTVQDGPMKVVRYGALTVNAALTTTVRNRGLMILCDSLTMGASGSISMTARGAAGAANWPVVDLTIPQSVRLSARYAPQRDAMNYITQNGIWIGDTVFWASPDAGVADCRATITPGSVVLLSAAGCGARTNSAGTAGANGGTGAGGGGGAYNNTIPTYGGEGRPWGGGSGGGGVGGTTGGGPSADRYGGVGGEGVMYYTGYYGAGGSGNPGGPGMGGGCVTGNDGTGGVLIIICRGNITRNATDSITANGVNGATQTGGSYPTGGGASGGGHVSIIYGGTLTGTGTTTANGGIGGSGSGDNGSDGGAGSVVTKTFAQMGWT